MQEHNWLLDCIKEVDAAAKQQGITGLINGLNHVLKVYAMEASSSVPERDRLLEHFEEIQTSESVI